MTETVSSDPKLSAAEREVTLQFATDEERATIHAEIPSVMRALLSREDAEIVGTREVEGDIVAVKVTVPIGAVKIQKEARGTNRANRVVTGHE